MFLVYVCTDAARFRADNAERERCRGGNSNGDGAQAESSHWPTESLYLNHNIIL